MPLEANGELLMSHQAVSLILQLIATAKLVVPNPENAPTHQLKVLGEVTRDLNHEMLDLMEEPDMDEDEGDITYGIETRHAKKLVKERLREHERLEIIEDMRFTVALTRGLIDKRPGGREHAWTSPESGNDSDEEAGEEDDDNGNGEYEAGNEPDEATVKQEIKKELESDGEHAPLRSNKREWEAAVDDQLDVKIKHLGHLRKRLRATKKE